MLLVQCRCEPCGRMEKSEPWTRERAMPGNSRVGLTTCQRHFKVHSVEKWGVNTCSPTSTPWGYPGIEGLGTCR